MVNFPVAKGTSGHLLGAALATFMTGPWYSMLILSIVLIVQLLLLSPFASSSPDGLERVAWGKSWLSGDLSRRGITRKFPPRGRSRPELCRRGGAEEFHTLARRTFTNLCLELTVAVKPVAHISFSMGGAITHRSAVQNLRGLEHLISYSDQLLLQSKRQGKKTLIIKFVENF